MNRRPAVEGMGSVGMAEPVGRDGKFDAGARCCLPHDTEYSQWPQNSAVALFAGLEDRITGLSPSINYMYYPWAATIGASGR